MAFSIWLFLVVTLAFSILSLILFSGLGRTWGVMAWVFSMSLGQTSTLRSSAAAARGSWMCLVNAVAPPDFCADEVSYGDSDGFSAVGVKPFVDQLV